MDRFNEILNGIAQAAGERFGGKKRSDLKDSDFLFPETKSFPIVTPADVPDAISNFGRMKGKMDYGTFLRKLYNMCKRKGPSFVAALPDSSKEQLGIKKKVSKAQEDEEDIEDYKESYLNMSIGSLRAIANHAVDILENLDNEMVQKNLTAAHLQGMIAVAEDHLRNIHDFVMFVDSSDDTEEEDETESAVTEINPTTDKKKKRVRIKDLPHYRFYPISDDEEEVSESGNKPGLWDNIRKKKEREGKNYKPAKPGDKDRPNPEQWKELTKASFDYKCPKCGLTLEYDRKKANYKCPNDGATMYLQD